MGQAQSQRCTKHLQTRGSLGDPEERDNTHGTKQPNPAPEMEQGRDFLETQRACFGLISGHNEIC